MNTIDVKRRYTFVHFFIKSECHVITNLTTQVHKRLITVFKIIRVINYDASKLWRHVKLV